MEKITFVDRPEKERDVIRKAYEFEVRAIIQESLATNPYYHTIKSMKDGDSIWEAIEFAVFLYFN